jgi:DNA/RNA endonuclease YhcR with UshA esterase domain
MSSAILLLLFPFTSLLPGDEKAFPPVEARQQVGKTITVQMTVQLAKDELKEFGEIYLDSEKDYKDKKNFAIAVTKTGAANLAKAGIANPVTHYQGKTIRVKGLVKVVDGLPRIEVNEADQIQLVKVARDNP